MSISGLGSLGGLVSGMETKTLIEKLMLIEAQPLVKMQQQQKKTELRKGLYQEINSTLLKLRSKVEALADQQKVLAKKLTSSDEKVVTAKMANAGQIVSGDYSINVTQLATAWTAKSANITSFANPTTKELGWSGTFQIKYADSTATQISKDITIEASDRLTDIAAKINSALENSTANKSMKVKATVVDNTLIFNTTETGAASTVQILNDTSGIFGAGKLGMTNGNTTAASFTSAVAGLNSEFTVNGVNIVRTKNTGLTDVIMGVDLTLLKQGEPTVSLKASADLEASQKVIQEFVDTYNSTMELLNARMNEQSVPDAKSDTLLSKGLLRGDSALSSIQSSLREITGKAFTGSEMFKTLNSIGITVDMSDKGVAGKLTIDSTKLQDALTRNPNEVMKIFFVDSNANDKLDVNDDRVGNGLAGMMYSKLFMLTDSTKVTYGRTSGSKGLVPSRMELMDSQIKGFTDRMESFNRRLEMRRKTLEAQFTSMEMMMQRSNSAAGFMMARMGAQ
ncbi:flagellar hook-associated protein 2 [Tumebacillus sp. BK434]|uniref:flagellar filament capping protein FliD n=1 Tax=Tumebacillus sp. BK434 TaxID=2512169 RepID=UPI0010453AFF|nr:flagellar filament capping protein FliD [Tumebacillus sp. BK434]TCP57841.1 flagellar hook-associated protein 2 [Tumebacillus sp. BK434]